MVDKPIDRIKNFNSFYISFVSTLNKHILESNFSLSETRVLFELYHRPDITARKIMRTLHIDEGYLSRMIEGFIKQDLAVKVKSDSDKRSFTLVLTPKGKAQCQKMNQASSKAVGKMIKNIPAKDLQLLLLMMEGIQNILTKSNESPFLE